MKGKGKIEKEEKGRTSRRRVREIDSLVISYQDEIGEVLVKQTKGLQVENDQ